MSLVRLTVAAGRIPVVLVSQPGAGACWSSWMGLTEAARKLGGLQQPAGQGSSAKMWDGGQLLQKEIRLCCRKDLCSS